MPEPIRTIFLGFILGICLAGILKLDTFLRRRKEEKGE